MITAIATQSTGKKSRGVIGVECPGVLEFDHYYIFRDVMRGANLRESDPALKNDYSTSPQNWDVDVSSPPQAADKVAFPRFYPVDINEEYNVRIRKKSDYDLPGTATIRVTGVSDVSQTTFSADGSFTITSPENGYGEENLLSVFIEEHDGDTVIEIWAGTPPPEGVSRDDKNYMFHPKIIEAAKPYRFLRSMDYNRINRSWNDDLAVLSTADLLPLDRSQADTQRGGHLRWFLNLCSVCGCDAWVNITHTADQSICDHYASECKTFLDENPGLEVYIEPSNECWNWGFWQCNVGNDQEPLYPYSAFRIGFEMAPTSWYHREIGYARIAANIFNMLDNAAVGGWSNASYTEIIGWQAAVQRNDQILDQFIIDRTGGKMVDCLAIAPYITWFDDGVPGSRMDYIREAIRSVTGESEGSESNLSELDASQLTSVDAYLVANYDADWMIDHMMTDPNQGMAASEAWIKSHAQNAATRGFRLLAYEANHHFSVNSSMLIPTGGHYLPGWSAEIAETGIRLKMGPMIKEFINLWFEHTEGDLYCGFTLVGKVRDRGTFGIYRTLVPEPVETPISKSFTSAVRERR